MPPRFHRLVLTEPGALLRLLSRPGLRGQSFQYRGARITVLLPRTVVLLTPDQSLLRGERQPDFTYGFAPSNLPLPALLKSELTAFDSAPSPVASGFAGGLAGWLGYDACPSDERRGPRLPGASFGLYDTFLYDEPGKPPSLFSLHPPALHYLQSLLTEALPESFRLTTPFAALTSPEQYERAFRRVHEYLLAGDCYQVNLAQDFMARCEGNSLWAFEALNDLMRPAYATYSTSPEGDILSLSPELFLRFGDGRVSTRPIKGTRPRGKTPDQDAALQGDLADHPKDRAENLMIVDLLRNDLGKHAETGSVRTTALFSIESLAHVHHMVSEVQCRLRPGSHPLDLLFDAFPGGSITGAPKKRAMEIIRELEGFNRTVYCGSMGWLGADGEGEWNIAIRTLARCGDELYAWAGGGIVADSDCSAEHAECLNKIGPILAILEQRFGQS